MRNSLFITLLTAITCFVSCKKKDTSKHDPLLTIPADVPGVAMQIDSFPLHSGYTWLYEVRRQTNRHDYNQVITSQTSVSVGDPVDHDSLRLYPITVSNQYIIPHPFLNASSNGALTALYANMPDGLRRWDTDDTTYTPASSALLLSKDSSQWHSMEYNDYYQRRIAGYVSVTVPAGTFNCIKVTTQRINIHEAAASYSCDQYFSDKGLIQQIITYYQQPNQPGTGASAIIEWTWLVSANF